MANVKVSITDEEMVAGYQSVIEEITGEVQDVLSKLEDIKETLESGEELDNTQQAFINMLVERDLV